MTAIAASTWACGSSAVPGGDGATWISAITATPRWSSSAPCSAILRSYMTSQARSRSRALCRRGLAGLGALGQDGGPLRDPPGDVLLGEPGVGEDLAAAAVVEELLRQADRTHGDVALAVLQRLG